MTFLCHRCGTHYGSQLDRIEHKLDAHIKQEEHDMSEIDDKLAAEDTALTALEADEARELADLQALKDAGQTLTADQEATFDSLTARITAADAAIDSADPAPVVDAPVDGTPAA